MIDGVRRYLAEQSLFLRDRIAVLDRQRGGAGLAAIDAEIATARKRLERIGQYAPEPNGDDVCPDCFANTGSRHVLRPIGSDDSAIDKFQCRECREIFETKI